MKIVKLLILVVLMGVIPTVVSAEIKQPGFGTSIGIVPKLPKTPNDPILQNGHVYPNWGPPCQRYTYSTIYQDKAGKAPEYMKIYFNGKMFDMTKADPSAFDFRKGVKYEYELVPNKLGSNFYYFEASNGLGKTRDSIIDSPDNGPVLFESAFDKNEIALIDPSSGKKVLQFPTGKEWVGGVALSDDGKYLATKTSQHVYLFDTSKNKPLWQFNCEDCRIGDDVKGGVDISGDGSKIIAAIGETTLLFDKSSSKPLWKYQKNNNNSYNVAISRDGKYMAAGTAGEESNVNSNLLILWNDKSAIPLWQYHASGNFHDVSLSDDG
ncbi:WD40 repeat domain-containing protein, partial [Candidatus Daviesbacteria bacterium]|nr:WD40 repeat domain-containing protein [Candidatus Daviesbacteria bacterium]